MSANLREFTLILLKFARTLAPALASWPGASVSANPHLHLRHTVPDGLCQGGASVDNLSAGFANSHEFLESKSAKIRAQAPKGWPGLLVLRPVGKGSNLG